MNVQEKIEKLIEQYSNKFDRLRDQEIKTFEEIKKLNTEVNNLTEQKDLLLFAEGIEVKKLSKVKANLRKANDDIKEKRELISDLREAKTKLEENFKVEVEPLQKELYKEKSQELRNIGREVQEIIDSATMKQIEMWDLQAEYGQVIGKVNSIGQCNFSYNIPVIEVMNDSVASVMKTVPISHVETIKKNGIEHYNTVYGRYGRMIR